MHALEYRKYNIRITWTSYAWICELPLANHLQTSCDIFQAIWVIRRINCWRVEWARSIGCWSERCQLEDAVSYVQTWQQEQTLRDLESCNKLPSVDVSNSFLDDVSPMSLRTCLLTNNLSSAASHVRWSVRQCGYIHSARSICKQGTPHAWPM